jgi:hypothetical protein
LNIENLDKGIYYIDATINNKHIKEKLIKN